MKKSIGLLMVISVFYMFVSKSVVKGLTIPDDALRIRIIPNSNSVFDQNIKKSVKDKLKITMFDLLKDAENSEEASNIIKSNLKLVDNDVKKVLDENNIRYNENFYEGFHPLVEKTMNIKSEHKVGERVLGIDPVSGKPVSVKIGRYGPVIQIGSAEDEEKPRFAQLAKGMSMETITLEEALDSFKLPRTLGDFEDKVVVVGVGRFGPYIRHNNVFVSIPKGTDPMEISLPEAVELIEKKREAAENKIIKSFDEEPGLQVLNGRYGPYIAYQKKNYKIPENVEPQDLDLETCFKVIELQKLKKDSKKSRYSTSKK